MKKSIIITAVCLLFPLLLAAKDVVYLNSGNVVSGKITNQSPGGDITIEIEKGKTLEYSRSDYYKIDLDGKAPKIKDQRRYVSFEDRSNRLYFFAAELSGGSTVEWKQKQTQPLQFSVVNGLRFSQFFQLGIGLGARYYINNNPMRDGYRPWSFPVYADIRGNFISHDGRNLVPYWSLDAGYTFGDRNFYFSPTVGVSIGGMRNNILVGVFYMGQLWNEGAAPLSGKFPKDAKSIDLLDGLGLKIGFQF